MVHLRISVAFVALSALLTVSALPADVAGSRALQARQVPCASSSSTSGDGAPRIPPQARAWEKRQRNRPGPGPGQNQGQGQQAPAPQTQGQAARPQARPNANANANANTNVNAQANRRPPQARDLGVIMRSAIAANDEPAPEDIELRGLQERQRVQPFPEQQDQNPPPPPQTTQQLPPPRTPGRLMRMRERRQAGQNGQPQDQNNQPPPPVPTPSPSPPAPAPPPATNNGNARPADRVPRSASRLFGRQRQGGNQPNVGNGAPQNGVPPPPASTTTTPPAPRPTPGNNNPAPAPNNAVDPNGLNGAQNGRQQRSAEVVTEDIDENLEERDSLADEYEEEL